MTDQQPPSIFKDIPKPPTRTFGWRQDRTPAPKVDEARAARQAVLREFFDSSAWDQIKEHSHVFAARYACDPTDRDRYHIYSLVRDTLDQFLKSAEQLVNTQENEHG